jgi:hypothetical protein
VELIPPRMLSDPEATDSGRLCEAPRRILPGPGGSRRSSASARAIGSDSSLTSREEGEGGPCLDGTRGSGMVIVGGTGGGGMELTRSGRTEATAVPAVAPATAIPVIATPPNGCRPVSDWGCGGS